MNKALLPVLLSLAFSPGAREELHYAPEPGVTITHTFLAVSETSLVSMQLEVDGEVVREVGEDELDGALKRSSTERIQLSDELESVQAGRATEFRRSFVELLQEYEETSGENEKSSSSRSDLEGISVNFQWDEDAEEFEVHFDDKECKVDKALLEHLSDDVDLRMLLPDGEVEVGDEWELEDAGAYLPLMWPGGLLGFYDIEQSGLDEDARADNVSIVEALEVTTSVTYEGEEERDGVRVALLAVSMQIQSGTEKEIEPEEGPAYTLSIAIERSIAGEVLWDLEHNHLHSAKFEGDLQTTITQAATVVNPETDEEFDVKDIKVLAGTIVYTLTVERE